MKRHKLSVIHEVILPNGVTADPEAIDLDLPDNFGFVQQKSVEELNDANKIKRQGALGFSLPMTPTNDRVLERFRTPAIIDNDFLPIPVEAWAGHVKLDFEQLEILNTDDRRGEYEAQITDADQHWIELAGDKKLRDLDLGDFEFTIANWEANVQDVLADSNVIWEEGNPLIWLPLLDMGNGGNVKEVKEIDITAETLTVPEHGMTPGGTREIEFFTDGTPPFPLVSGQSYLVDVTDDETLTLQGVNLGTVGNGTFYIRTNEWFLHEIRPLFSVPGVLKTGFAQIGWKLEGEIFETDWCKRKWDYILAPDYWDNDGNKDFVVLSLEKTADQSIFPPGTFIEFETIVEDGGGNVFVESGNNVGFINNTDHILKILVTGTFIIENATGSPIIAEIFLAAGDTLNPDYQNVLTATIPAGTTETHSLEREISLNPAEFALFVSGNLDLTIKAGSTFEVSLVEFKGILPGATIPLEQLIHPDYTLLDRFKGFLHLGDFKLQTNLETKTITVFPSENSEVIRFRTDIDDPEFEEIDGFWQPEYEQRDMSAQVEPRSRLITMRSKEAARYVSIKFKDSSDAFIKEVLKLPEGTQLHSRLLDLGDKYKPGEPFKVENPFYEPTAEHRAGGVVVPALWDNNNYRASYNIKPRIFHGFDWSKQFFGDGEVEVIGTPTEINNSHYFFEGTEYSFLPYATQLSSVVIQEGLETQLYPHNVVYGTEETDLFTMFWDKGRFIRATLPEYSFLVRLSLEDFMAENFRQRWFIHYAGEGFIYRLQRMYNHNTGNEASTECIFLPEPNSTT